MRFQRSVATWAGIVLVMVAADVQAQNGKGSTPNGRAFQQIQSQFDQVNQELAALEARVAAIETRIAGVEGALDAQIAILNANLGALRERIVDVESAVAALEGTVGANTTAIGALETAVADLDAALQDAKADLATATGDLSSLKGEVSTIASLIETHESQISNLQQQNALILQFLTNLVNGTCQAGAAISDIASGGFIACTTAGAGGNLSTHSNVAMGTLGIGSNTMIVGCQAGYTLASSGYTTPSTFEHHSYLKPNGTTGVISKSNVSVTASFAFNGQAVVTVSYTPNTVFGNTWAVVANCVKVS